MSAPPIDLTSETIAKRVVAEARDSATRAVAALDVVAIIAAANRRWATEAHWSDRIHELFRTSTAPMPATDELPDLEALLDPSLWSRRLAESPADSTAGGVRTVPVPLGVVLHVCPGNGVSTALWSLLHGVLAGNQNLVKLSAKTPRVVPVIVDLLVLCGLPASQVQFVDWKRDAEDVRRALLTRVDGVAVWGDDTTMETFRRDVPPGVRWIERGPRLSIAVLTRRQRPMQDLESLVFDACVHEQRSCASTQCLLLEAGSEESIADVRATFLREMGAAFAAYTASQSPPDKSVDAQVEILKRLELAKVARLRGEGDFVSGYPDWLVVWQDQGPLLPSCLFRTLYVRPFRSDEELRELLAQVRRYLQTAALACSTDERQHWVDVLWRAGVNRIVAPGRTSALAPGAPQDGRFLLPEFFRMVTDESPCISLKR
jgi:hypothetical protein